MHGSENMGDGCRSMKRKLLKFGRGFRVAIGNRRSQAAEMVLNPSQCEGSARNRHRGADQWLFVVAGSGVAKINGKNYSLKSGTLLLIEHGDRHQIQNTGRSLLRTLNVYVPPAYRANGTELPAARP